MTSPSRDSEIVVLPDHAAFVTEAAERIARRCGLLAGERPEYAIALAGGGTPGPIYERLASEPYRSRIPWDRIRFFWGDERCVPMDDPRSNFRAGWQTLLSRVPVPADHVHRMPGDQPDLDRAAYSYEELMRTRLPRSVDGWPRFDLILLGLGEDAHIASLFPRAPALHETERAVVAYNATQAGAWRMTVTPPVLNSAVEVLLIVSGPKKADAVWKTLEGPRDPDAVPAQCIRPSDGCCVWLMDAPAASRLSSPRASGHTLE